MVPTDSNVLQSYYNVTSYKTSLQQSTDLNGTGLHA